MFVRQRYTPLQLDCSSVPKKNTKIHDKSCRRKWNRISRLTKPSDYNMLLIAAPTYLMTDRLNLTQCLITFKTSDEAALADRYFHFWSHGPEHCLELPDDVYHNMQCQPNSWSRCREENAQFCCRPCSILFKQPHDEKWLRKDLPPLSAPIVQHNKHPA